MYRIMKDISSAEKIKIYTLGQFSLVKNGEVFIFPTRARTTVALLKALLTVGERGANADLICDELWPMVDGDTAHNALNVTLYRLRRLLGEQRAIPFTDNRLRLDPHMIWVDAWELEHHMRYLQAQFNLPIPDVASVQTDIQKLLELFKGPFLEGESGAWIITARERLNSAFLCLIDRIGQYWEKNINWPEACNLYLKGLELEPRYESFYQRLMICHREMGQRSEAVIIYRRCREALLTHLDLPPSGYTESLYKSLVVS